MTFRNHNGLAVLISSLALGFAAGCGRTPGTSELPETVVFNEHIRPIFAKNCAACHGGVKKSGGLSFAFEQEAIATGESGNLSIVPGSPKTSHLISKITSTDPTMRMPPPEHGPALEEREIALLQRWIEQGADWEEHWAFTAPRPLEPPQPEDDAWSRNDIDRFILARLRKEGLEPAPEADRGALLRRVTLDLTGVPPTTGELDNFLADTSSDAYRIVVDRLLASPRYGERWATMWLDLARYADSKGLGQDGQRTMYKYRDWVIRAFNEDMPFDQFSIKQLAGDLLPEPSLDDFLATTFHRNTQIEDEGGTSDEEFRVVAVLDRVNTTWQTWHGTTFGCVQCHSHPYDPFRNEEYYRFMAYFNNTQDCDTPEDYPRMSFPVDEARQAEVNDLAHRARQLKWRLWKTAADLAEEGSTWHWLRGMKQTTNRPKQMDFREEVREGRPEFVFAGTPARITHTIEADIPRSEKPIQALRIEVLPQDLENAKYRPSPGFLLDGIDVFLLPADGSAERKLVLDRMYIDDPFPFFGLNPDPEGKNSGFSAYTFMFHPRWAVFRLKEPLRPAEGDRIRFKLVHGRSTGGMTMMVMRRGAIAVSDDAQWRTLEDNPDRVQRTAELKELEQELRSGAQVSIPVLIERPPHLARETKRFVRGNWTDLGETVQPAVPASLHSLPESDEPARLQMARWLVDKQNPLTARVLVCRFWEQLFGTGIVETLEDFGTIGEKPSHPALLDSLALRLMNEFDWSMKSLVREVVMSATYCQSSRATPELIERDPRNRLLARGPRNRLSGEMVRDQFLSVAGLLNDKMYGPPIMPQQPEGGWNPIHPGSGKWNESKGDERYRRSIYIHWQRSSIYPVLEAFDAPSRMLCSDRRMVSNTPVQPLFTLNDPALFEAVQKFSERMQAGADTLEDRIALGYRLATCQGIPPSTLAELSGLYTNVVEIYPLEEAEIRAALEPSMAYSADQAAYDTIATVLLNLDAVLTK